MSVFGLYLGFAMLLVTLLAMNVSRLRMREKIANGDGGSRPLRKATRAHMNALEHILPFTLLLLFLDMHPISAWLFSALAFGFLVVRFLHGYSMLTSRFRLRQITAGLTYLFEVSACLLVVVRAVY